MNTLKLVDKELTFNINVTLLQEKISSLLVVSKLLGYIVREKSLPVLHQYYIEIVDGSAVNMHILFNLDHNDHVEEVEIWDEDGVSYRGLYMVELLEKLEKLIDWISREG